ncbi:VOC family protein [Proteiniclasticum ruminis]|uniref:VOC family protein n=1 Tax=Proteiniclasticum ruminis TaxID=398199 RepID=UPI002898DB50|nr:VOC family protein [Proteiniclasticum ruminis]
MAVGIYLIFNGNCREAVEFYSEVFGSVSDEIMTFGDHPSSDYPLSEEEKKLIMHTSMRISGDLIMFSDAFPGSPVTVGENVSIMVTSKDMEELKAQFHKIKEGGRVEMDLQETFWSKCYGATIDQFGVSWQFNHEE